MLPLPVDSGYGYTRELDGGGGAPTQKKMANKVRQEVQNPCGENKNGKNDKNATGHPVRIATGTKFLPEFDLPSVGEGIPLTLNRLYQQGNTKIGAFGPSWSSNIDYTLVFEYQDLVCWAYLDHVEPCVPGGKPLLTVYAYGPSGYPVRFNAVDGQWRSAQGHVAAQENGGWVVRYANGNRHEFDGNGRPLRILGERGIGLSYGYDTGGRLTRITHTSGRFLTLTWIGGKVASVTGPNGERDMAAAAPVDSRPPTAWPAPTTHLAARNSFHQPCSSVRTSTTSPKPSACSRNRSAICCSTA